MGCLSERFARPKPWYVLGVTRRQYETARPWKLARMERGAFDALVASLPHDYVTEKRRGFDAQQLVNALFKDSTC